MGAPSVRRAFVLGVALAILVTLPVAAPVASVDAVAGPASPTPTTQEHITVDLADDKSTSERWTGRHPPAIENEPAPEAAAGNVSDTRHRLTLVTGETVVVSRRDGELSVEAVEGGPVSVVETNDETYLLPDDVDPARYDRSLFAVDWLIAQRSAGGVPVLLDANASRPSVDTTGLQNVRYLESAGVIAAEVDPATAPDAIADLVADGSVERVSIDRPYDRLHQPAEPASTIARPYGGTGEGVTVAVLDTGIDSTHPDLADRVVGRVDLVDGDGGGAGRDEAKDRPLDPHGHGTIVAGVVAGSGEASDDQAYAGVAPDAALVDVRVMDDRGVAQASTIIAGIEYAVEADVDVILLSIGSSIDGSDAIARSVEWATEQGVIVVAAAGNEGQPRSIGAPGRPDGVITVGATDGDGRVASYASRGPTLDGRLKPDLLAPGSGIVGPRAEGSGRVAIDDAGRYTRTSGTSVAAPQVAGAAALLLEAEPGLSAREVENRLASAARPIDGAGAYAQGSGAIDLERALDPDVVAQDAVIDFGLVETDEVRSRAITLVNHDDRRHELSFTTTVRNVDLDRDAGETAWLNRTRLSLAPGERTTLRLVVDGNTSSGAHAGAIRYTVDGEPRSIAFGFVRGGRVTVEKRPLTAGDAVDGDELWVFTEEGTHDELLSFSNGTASFVAGGGTYVLWSTGYDEASGTTVFLSERRVVDGPTHVVLEEAHTVPVGVDVEPLEDRYGPLANRSVDVSMSTEYAGGLARRSVSRANLDGRAVRVSPDPELDVATAFLLSTGRESAELDVPDVFHLANGVRGVRGASVVEVTPDRLETIEYHYYRTSVDETYRAWDRVTLDDVWSQQSSRWFGLGERTTQRVHRLTGEAKYNRLLRGDAWTAQSGTQSRAGALVDVLPHPMLGLVELAYASDGNVTVAGTPFSDGSGTRLDPVGEHTLTAIVDGEVARKRQLAGGFGSLGDLVIDPGQSLTVRLEGNDPDGHLSTRTLTEVTLPADAAPEHGEIVVRDRPPLVTDLAFVEANDVNAVEPGTVTLAVDVDLVGTVVDPVVWYSNESPAEPPWANESAWDRADVDRSRDRLLATMDVAEDSGRISVAVELRDIWGRRTRTMTTDAVHVGAAPNTSTSTIAGQFLAADGTPAANDTIVLRPVDGGTARYVRTDGDGRFEVEVPRTRSYDLVYARGEPWQPRTPVEDDRPAWLPLARVDAAEDVDLGVWSLPPARELTVNVTDERGESVAGTSVRVSQRAGYVSASEVLVTDERGRAQARGSETAGIELAGPVQVIVTPPGDGLYPDRDYRFNVSAREPETLRVTLETAPPKAALTAFGSFEAGRPVYLDAFKSDVPAGAVEYRWDFDGDGDIDRVTGKPNVEFVPDGETLHPRVTVVDEAGKTDSATLTLQLASG